MKMVFKGIIISLLSTAAVATSSVGVASAEQFWTPEALLGQQFKRSTKVSYVRVHVDAAQRAKLRARLGRDLPKLDYTFFVARSGEHIDGFALFDEQIGQHEPISFATFFDPAGQITRVEVVSYREPYGDGIRAERFRRQFVGRNVASRFRPGDDIDIISGATISSRSACIAVERAAALFDATLRGSSSAVLAAR
jgi:Na+-translocating ferredoxin:NAD+ oxidoreductase subunit G